MSPMTLKERLALAREIADRTKAPIRDRQLTAGGEDGALRKGQGPDQEALQAEA